MVKAHCSNAPIRCHANAIPRNASNEDLDKNTPPRKYHFTA
jgi:hypothetical protein